MPPRWLLPAPEAAPMAGLVPGAYGAILADPPWAFETWDGRGIAPARGAQPYRVTALDQMAALPVADYAAPDCALFMWAIGSHLDQAIALGEGWGFRFVTDIFYWAKQKLIAPDQIDLFTGDIPPPKIGMGHWTRKQIEPCLLFTRGRPRRMAKDVRQLIVAPAREHGRKPDEARAAIEALVEGPYAEIFSRQSAPGWDCWGDEAGKFDAAPAKPAPALRPGSGQARMTRHEGEFTLVDGGTHG